ncbi:hypothetical protein VTN49DRAFT_4092 [Thermomyces lanuginosus]|uniref:uncharacterized protein n=1 Tax=Thermomyces lanuginosus TaxID=5541 RepID=UPI00374485A4
MSDSHPSSSSSSTAARQSSQQQQQPRVLSASDLNALRQGGQIPNRGPHPSIPPRRPVDIRQTPEYKRAARRWIATIVALPVLFFSSCELYQRVYGGKQKRRPVRSEQPAIEDSAK